MARHVDKNQPPVLWKELYHSDPMGFFGRVTVEKQHRDGLSVVAVGSPLPLVITEGEIFHVDKLFFHSQDDCDHVAIV